MPQRILENRPLHHRFRNGKNNAAVALGLLLCAAAAMHPVRSEADAMADQKKAYKALGATVPKEPALCNLLTLAEVEKYLGKRVQAGTSAGPVSGCAWRAADGSNDGLLVTRGARGDWYPPSGSKKVEGIGEKAYTAYEAGIGYEAVALAANGVTNVQFSGKASAADALAVLRIAVKR
jgi:hypothetical protein